MPLPAHRLLSVACSLASALIALPTAFGQATQADPAAPEQIHIVHPTIDKANARVSIPAAFWKEDVADWVETALCGRPSDFLHETVLSVTTTRALLEGACREVGFRDADAWVGSVQDFPRVRGDRMLVTLEFQQDGKPQKYSLDELLQFEGWGVSIGPYGFMFRGDPGNPKRGAATAPATQPGEKSEDATIILRDDPQISLIFKGLQSVSQSFADHPLAYDDWIFPMPNMMRNYAVLPAKIMNSNGSVVVTLTLQKVTEEQFLTESSKIWHDAGWQDLIKSQIPVGQEIDKQKAALWAIKSKPAFDLTVQERQQIPQIEARIERGYTTLDAAWAAYSVDHAQFATHEEPALSLLKQSAARWKQHMALNQISATQRATAAEVAFDAAALSAKPALTDAEKIQLRVLNGREIAAMAAARAADSQQPLEYWKAEQARLDPGDTRSDWIKIVKLQQALCEARLAAAAAGISYGQGLQAAASPPDLPQREGNYTTALKGVRAAELRVNLANLDFQIKKIESLAGDGGEDPELPGLKSEKKSMQDELASLESQLQTPPPATAPKPP